ncbi:MAG: BON domain-containing protein [Candidatus Acidiferrales bacterium]|jgi:hyperosmotically inducible protein
MEIRHNLLKFARASAALALATSMIGAYGASAATTTQNPVDEQSLNKHVHHALVMNPWYGVFDNIEYQLNGTEVVLTGQVVLPVTKSDAEKAVMRVAGVTQVVDNITVLPVSRFDDQIRRAEFRAIFSGPTLGRYATGVVPSIHIIVNNGNVTLEGAVMNQMDSSIARIRANQVPDVFSVTNNLHIG